ncbi:MAG: UvrD-helicase domain-containing protein, partial [Candidatus Korobacteraceae bacterium]
MIWDHNLTGKALAIAGTDCKYLRVMAGPGTGKTFALKRRVARLLEEGVDPERLLVVTFTRVAAASLVKELGDLGVEGCEDITAVGTLHSFCFRTLNSEEVFDFSGRVPRPLVTFPKAGVLQFEGAPLLEDIKTEGKRKDTKRIRAFEAAWARLQSDQPGWPLD